MALIPLYVIDVSDATEETSNLAVGDYIDFKASSTTFGRLSSTGFAGSGSPIAIDSIIKISVKLAMAITFEIEYDTEADTGLTIDYIYLPICTTETDFWLDNHGNVFSDVLLTVSVDGTNILVFPNTEWSWPTTKLSCWRCCGARPVAPPGIF